MLDALLKARQEASIEADLMLDGDELEIEFDFANLMRGDAASRSAYYQSGIQNGWLTRNEARIAENLNPIAGLDQPLRPLNMIEEEDAEEAEMKGPETEQPESEEPEPDESTSDSPPSPMPDMSQRMQALVTSNARRLARRISKKGAVGPGEIELVSQSFGLDLETVQAWALNLQQPLDESALTDGLVKLGMQE